MTCKAAADVRRADQVRHRAPKWLVLVYCILLLMWAVGWLHYVRRGLANYRAFSFPVTTRLAGPVMRGTCSNLLGAGPEVRSAGRDGD